MIHRRNFIRNSSLAALAVSTGSRHFQVPAQDRALSDIGIQLYMVREEMNKDVAGTLKQLASIGYRQIESYGGDKGMFWGMTNKQFQSLAASFGLRLVSSHFGDDDGVPFEKKAADAAGIGMKYLICPWKGPQPSIDHFKKIADEFNQRGEICRSNGIRFGYHPHDYPYKKIDGQLPIDLLLDHTDAGLVDYEMDFYYTVTEGADPYAYLKKYSGRFRLCHMRDVLKIRLPAGSKEESACDLGQGIIDYSRLLGTGIKHGMEYFFVEQSRYVKETPLESARINYAYLKNLSIPRQ